MRRRHALPVAIATLFTAPALAADIPMVPVPVVVDTPALLHAGYLAVYGGVISLEDTEIDVPDAAFPVIGARAAASLPFHHRFSVQFDAAGELPFGNDDDGDATTAEWLGAIHLSHRDPSSHLLGVFAGGGSSYDNGDGNDSTGDADAIPFYFAGVEGQHYRGNSTIYAQAGYLDSEDRWEETISGAVFARLAAYHYVGDNARVGLEGSYLHGERFNGGDSGHAAVYGWGASFKYRHHDWLNMVVEYNGFLYEMLDSDESDSPFSNEVRVGLEVPFGAPASLLDSDRLGVANSLPPISRWISTLANEIE